MANNCEWYFLIRFLSEKSVNDVFIVVLTWFLLLCQRVDVFEYGSISCNYPKLIFAILWLGFACEGRYKYLVYRAELLFYLFFRLIDSHFHKNKVGFTVSTFIAQHKIQTLLIFHSPRIINICRRYNIPAEICQFFQID